MKIHNLLILATLCFIVYHVSKNVTEWVIGIIDRKFQ